jgi:DNA-binding beta-propeller fold protein YncE
MVWVLSIHEPRLARLDPVTREPRGRQPLVGRGAADIAAYRGTVWVAKAATGKVLGLDARDGRLRVQFTTPLPPVRVAAGPTGVWVGARASPAGPSLLLRYDRAGRALSPPVTFEDDIRAVALGRGSAWVALAPTGRVMRVAPGMPAVRVVRLTHPASRLAYGAGRLWATLPEEDSLARIAPGRKQFLATAAGRRPTGVAVAGGRVFVTSTTGHRVLVFDPDRVQRPRWSLPVPPNPSALAPGPGHLWVTGMGQNTITRIDY